MPKVKVTKDIQEYIGDVEEKVATPFGNSAHINVGKKHTGKIIPIVNQQNPEYKWVLPMTDLDKVLKECKRLIKDGKHKKLQEFVVNKLKTKFLIQDLAKVVEILKQDNKNKALVKKIKDTYNL